MGQVFNFVPTVETLGEPREYITPLPRAVHSPTTGPPYERVFFADPHRLPRNFGCWWNNQPTRKPTHPLNHQLKPVPTNLYLCSEPFIPQSYSAVVLEQPNSNRFDELHDVFTACFILLLLTFPR